MQTALLDASDSGNMFAVAIHLFQRILLAVVHRRRQCHRGWIEGLNLICSEFVALQPQGKIYHVVIGGAWVCGDKVGD